MTEMSKLALKLMEADIPFDVNIQKIGAEKYPQIILYNVEGDYIGDAICNIMSYGHEDGLLEIKGFDIADNDVQGYLTADLVFDWILNYSSEHN